MNNSKYSVLALAALLATATTSCDKDKFLDVNQSPNSLSTASPGVVLSNVEIATGFGVGNNVFRNTSVLVQHFAGIGNQAAITDQYNLENAQFTDDLWNYFYQAPIVNSNKLIEIADRVNSPAFAGIGKLQKAYNFAVLTDLYGDIPYSQAAIGLENVAPRFDKQEDIYKGNGALGIKSLFDLVREGLADLDKPLAPTDARPTASDDLVYAGDLTKWKKMGNTLLLKLANTISRKEPALAAQIIKEVTDKGATAYMTSNSDDYEVPFGTSQGNKNPIQSNAELRPNDLMLSQRLLDSMNVRNDPRLPRFFTLTPTRTATVNTTGTTTTLVGTTADTPPVTGPLTFTGYQNNSGQPLPSLLTNRSRVGIYLTGSGGEAPIRLLTNFQRAFILAEDALNRRDYTQAQTFYREGITASMTKAGVPAATVTAYFTANPRVANLEGTDDRRLNQIITQKWIAWVGNGYEPYNDYRRTGYPRLQVVPSAQNVDPSRIPSRFPYPASELSSNAANSPGLIATNVPVWWAIR